MQRQQNFRKEIRGGVHSGGSHKHNFTADQNHDPPSDETGINPELGNERQPKRQPDRCQSYSVVVPNEKKRRDLLQQREKNMQYYEEVKAKNQMMYDSGRPQKIGGPKVSKDELLERRIKDQKKAENLERRKSYEQKKKREKWAAERKEIEDKEINDKKQRARVQAERNEEKKIQDEVARRQKYDNEMRRRWMDMQNHDTRREPEPAYSSYAEMNDKPSADELRDIYAKRYSRVQIHGNENGGQCSYDAKMRVRSDAQRTPQRRGTNEFTTSLYECTDRFSTQRLEDDKCLRETGEDDIRKLCQMFPYATREFVADIYLQTNSSLEETWRILSIE